MRETGCFSISRNPDSIKKSGTLMRARLSQAAAASQPEKKPLNWIAAT